MKTSAGVTGREMARLRLVAQRIVGPCFTRAADAVRWLTAVQAQDLDGALVSVALRTASGRHDVEAALDAGEVVKSWPMRGTLHLVVAEDLPWMLDLMTPRVLVGAATRRARLGLDGSIFEQARELAVEALAGGRARRRAELLAVWDQAGVPTSEQRGYHLLWHLAQTGTLCFGPMDRGEQLIVLVEEWIPNPRRLGREEALAELAERYFRSHGPATVHDFMRWTKLLAADARLGLALARPRLTLLEAGGIEHFMDPETPDLLEAWRQSAAEVVLLPGFDELILGYEDRTCVLSAEHAGRIVPGGNGVFRPTVVDDGQVIGTWKRVGRGSKRTVVATPFTSFPTHVSEAIPQVAAALP